MNIDILHGYGSGKPKVFKKTGSITSTLYPSYSRIAMAKDYAFITDDANTAVYNLITSTQHIKMTGQTSGWMKATSHENALYGLASNQLRKFDINLNTVWTCTDAGNTSWGQVTFDDSFVYTINSSTAKIHKISRSTGVTAKISTNTVNTAGSATMGTNDDGTKVIFVQLSGTTLYVSIFNTSDLSLWKSMSTTLSYSSGSLLGVSLFKNTLILLTAQTSYSYVSLFDISTSSLTVTGDIIGLPQASFDYSLSYGMICQTYKDGLAVNLGYKCMFLTFDESSNSISLNIPFNIEAGITAVTNKRYAFASNLNRMFHGEYK